MTEKASVPLGRSASGAMDPRRGEGGANPPAKSGHRAAYPFSAVVGQEELQLALVLAAVDRAIGGVLLRGQKGSAKTTAARGLAALLPGPAPFVELPLGASEDRVVGTVDLRAMLHHGTEQFVPGLLADADNGVLYIDEVNLLPDHLVDVLLDVAATGVNRVEREGVSHQHASRFVLLGSMNPEEGELRPQFLDRFGLAVDVVAPVDPQQRAEAVRRRLAFDQDPPSFAALWAQAEAALAARLARTRPAPLADDLVDKVALLCVSVGAEGLRADLVCCRAAAALAGWEGKDEAGADEVRRVAAAALAHRRRRSPFDSPGFADDELQAALDEIFGPPAAGPSSSSASSGAADTGTDGVRTERPSGAAETSIAQDPASRGARQLPRRSALGGTSLTGSGGRRDRGGGRDSRGQSSDAAPEGGESTNGATLAGNVDPGWNPGARSGSDRRSVDSARRNGECSGGELPSTAASRSGSDGTGDAPVDQDAALPFGEAPGPSGGRPGQEQRELWVPPMVSRLLAGDVVGSRSAPATATGRRAPALGPSGRRIGSRAVDGPVSSVALSASVRAAAERGSSTVEAGDLRQAVYEQRTGQLVVLAVDASGSMGAARRLAAATDAAVSLLLDAYQRRDKVALVTFGGAGAVVALAPTGSVEVARARLTDLATGGRTPLADGILTALDVARGAARTGHRPLVVLVSDGRATAGRDGEDPVTAALAAADAVRRAGIAGVVVDVEDGAIRLGLAATVAEAMGARHVPAADLTSEMIASVAQ